MTGKCKSKVTRFRGWRVTRDGKRMHYVLGGTLLCSGLEAPSGSTPFVCEANRIPRCRECEDAHARLWAKGVIPCA